MDTPFSNMEFNKINKKIIKQALSSLNQNDKEEYLIYFVIKDDGGEEDENEDNIDEDEELSIQILGEEFVKKNQNNCKIIINGKEEELKQFYFNKNKEEIIMK